VRDSTLMKSEYPPCNTHGARRWNSLIATLSTGQSTSVSSQNSHVSFTGLTRGSLLTDARVRGWFTRVNGHISLVGRLSLKSKLWVVAEPGITYFSTDDLRRSHDHGSGARVPSRRSAH